jgi:hypothetical protein
MDGWMDEWMVGYGWTSFTLILWLFVRSNSIE